VKSTLLKHSSKIKFKGKYMNVHNLKVMVWTSQLWGGGRRLLCNKVIQWLTIC